MWGWIDRAVDLVAAHPGLALTVAFLGAIIEAVAVLGILIPGTPIVMAAAGAAAMAGQPMVPFLVVAVIGAVIGDFVSFWAGQKFSFRIQSYWPFTTKPNLMANAIKFFRRRLPHNISAA
jgi:undecaprenyl-diphosphatase